MGAEQDEKMSEECVLQFQLFVRRARLPQCVDELSDSEAVQ